MCMITRLTIMTTTMLMTIMLMAMVSIDAQAYVGPGLGAGAIGMILGVLASILLAVFAIFWYPIKRLLKKRRQDDAA